MSPNFQTSLAASVPPALTERKEASTYIWGGKRKLNRKLEKEQTPNLQTCHFHEKNKAKSAFYYLPPKQKTKSVLLLYLQKKEGACRLRTSLVPLAESRSRMKRLTTSAKLLFPLSGLLSGRQERKEKNEHTDTCQASVSL